MERDLTDRISIRLPRGRSTRQVNGERSSTIEAVTVDRNVPAVHLDERLANGEAETKTRVRMAGPLLKRIEDYLALVTAIEHTARRSGQAATRVASIGSVAATNTP